MELLVSLLQERNKNSMEIIHKMELTLLLTSQRSDREGGSRGKVPLLLFLDLLKLKEKLHLCYSEFLLLFLLLRLILDHITC